MTIGLAMIVKDASDVIERALASVREHITTWTILDTGSTDDTPALIQSSFEGIPGQLHHGEFVNFGHTRTRLMQLARGSADYLLLLDADLTIEHPGQLHRHRFTHDILEGTVHDGNLRYTLPILVRGDRFWRYEGVAHSYLTRDGEISRQTLEGLIVHDHGTTSREKLERDVDLLAAEHARSPLDPRTVFYLAQTHRDLGNHAQAIHYYRMRAHMDGWDEERFYARYRLGVLLCEHVSFTDGAVELVEARRMRPGRNEPLVALANAASNVARKTPFPEQDRLFVNAGAYNQDASK